MSPEFEFLTRLIEVSKDPNAAPLLDRLEAEGKRLAQERKAFEQERLAWRESLWREWNEFLVLSLRLLKDGGYFVLSWSILWAIHWITTVGLPMHGRLVETFHTAHEIMVVSINLIVGVAVLWDVFEARIWRRITEASKRVRP